MEDWADLVIAVDLTGNRVHRARRHRSRVEDPTWWSRLGSYLPGGEGGWAQPTPRFSDVLAATLQIMQD